jgi:hypothetical protein
MPYETMHAYYREQEVLPTHGRFRTRAELEAHERQRRELFTEKLLLPPRLFRDARLIEFGPDAGENSLVFALWGANCTLVEPNPKAHPVITNYFQEFKLKHKIAALDGADIAEFARRPSQNAKFDFIDAEGFIYTVKPESLWIDLFRNILADDGYVVLFYCEPYGNFLELFTKAIYRRIRQITGQDAVDAARSFFLTKWNSISHKRALKSWVMDVMENPFVRLRYFIEPQFLCRQMQEAGLALYSSWPPYKDGLSVHWFKTALTPQERLQSQNAFIARSRLSHMFGRPHFLRRVDPVLEKSLWNLLTLTDGLIDQCDTTRVEECEDELCALERFVSSDSVISEEADTIETVRAIRSLQQILRLMTRDSVDELLNFCNNDKGFIRTWGGPSHFAIFRNEAS